MDESVQKPCFHLVMSPNRDDEDDCSDEEEGLILKEKQSSPSWRRVQRTKMFRGAKTVEAGFEGESPGSY